MGVYEETATRTPGMHWQPHEQYSTTGPAYDPSRDLSPNLPPSCGDSTTPINNNKTTPILTNTNNLMNSNNNSTASSTTNSTTSSSNTTSADLLDQQHHHQQHHHHHHHHHQHHQQQQQHVGNRSPLLSGNGSPNHHNNNNHLGSCGADVCNNNNNNSTSRNNNNNIVSTGGSSSLVELCSYTNRIGSFEQHIPKIEPSPTPPPPPPPPPPPHHHPIHHQHSLPLPPPPSHLYNGLCICAGCGLKIVDRFYLQAIDRRWHATCLQCCQCKYALDGERTCFSRGGNIYCRKDYYRLFGMKRCARCHESIPSSELVMRARELVFHVHCFSCAVCHLPLTKGDHYGMRDNVVLCRLHFELSLTEHPPTSNSGNNNSIGAGSRDYIPLASPEYKPNLPRTPHHGMGGSPHHVAIHHHHLHHMGSGPFGEGALGPGGPGGSLGGPVHHPPQVGTPGSLDGGDIPLGMGGNGPSGLQSQHQPKFFNGAPGATPRQKGRPRKRKPKDLEAMTANLDLNSDYLDMSFGRSPGTPGMPGSNQRTKRMRTSFKHHQLRTMKSYFSINHNPDAKDLKQLSQKTGLPKRVLQVWFQNARAKWRRMTLKQEGKGGNGDKCSPCGTDGLSDLDLYPDPASIAGSIQSLNPHSPQFMLPGSPSSLDCS